MKRLFANKAAQHKDDFENEGLDQGTVFPFKRRALKKPMEKPLLPTLCDDCYNSFEHAAGQAVAEVVNFVACYCPHTQCLVTLEIVDENSHCTGVYGPMEETMAQALVNERFAGMELEEHSGSFQ
jgi:hypothetical protein